MSVAVATNDPALIEKLNHQEDVQRVRRCSAKAARASAYFKRREKACNGSNGQQKKKTRTRNPARGSGRNGKTSLTRNLSAPAKTIQDLFRRELQDQGIDPEVNGELNGWDGILPPDPVLSLLESVVGLLRDGEDIDEYRERLVTLLSGEKQMAELNEALLRIHDRHRLIRLVQVQDFLEHFMIDCIYRKDLQPGEGLAAAQMLGKETDAIRTRLRDPRSYTATDVEGLVAQINPSDIMKDKELAERFAGTTPMSRDLIRKLALTILKTQKKKQNAGTGTPDLPDPGNAPEPAPSIEAPVEDIAQKNGAPVPVDDESDLSPPAAERTPEMEAFIARWRGKIGEQKQQGKETPSPSVVASAPSAPAERTGRPARVFVA